VGVVIVVDEDDVAIAIVAANVPPVDRFAVNGFETRKTYRPSGASVICVASA